MKLPKRYEIEKTTYITVGGTAIPLSTLPEEIAAEFAVIDKIKQEASELTMRLEILSLAIQAKTRQISAQIAAEYAKNKQEAKNSAELRSPSEPDADK